MNELHFRIKFTFPRLAYLAHISWWSGVVVCGIPMGNKTAIPILMRCRSVVKFLHFRYKKNRLPQTPPSPYRRGTALAWRWGLWAPRIVQIPLFRNPKRSRLLRVFQFGLKNPAYGVLKSPGYVCSQGVLAVQLLASILRS